MEPHRRPQPDEAMRTDLRQDGLDLCAAGTLWLAATAQNTDAIGKSVRIGLTRNVDRQWRFYERGNPYVSVQRGYPSNSAANYTRVLIRRIPVAKTGSGRSGNFVWGSDSPLRSHSRRPRIHSMVDGANQSVANWRHRILTLVAVALTPLMS